MCAVASARPTISQPRESSPSSARCPCAWTRGGTRSSLTCQISRAARTEPTTSRRSASRSTPTAASEGSTFQIACTQKTSCPQSSSSSCRCRTNRRDAPARYSGELSCSVGRAPGCLGSFLVMCFGRPSHRTRNDSLWVPAFACGPRGNDGGLFRGTGAGGGKQSHAEAGSGDAGTRAVVCVCAIAEVAASVCERMDTSMMMWGAERAWGRGEGSCSVWVEPW